jgi:hypothetical protein
MASKFFQMPAAVPCPPMQGWMLSASVGDVDGDGRQEIVALASSQDSLFFVTLSQLKRSELTPLWNGADQDAWGQMVVMDARLGAIAGTLDAWALSLDDTFVMADLDNDGADEIVAFDHASYVGVFKWQQSGSGGTQTWAQSLVYLQSGTMSGPAGTWSIGPNDQFLAADVDDDGKQEIVVFDGQSRIGVLKWQNSVLSLIGLTVGQIPSASGGNSWVMGAGDKFATARLGVDRIFVFDSNSWISVLEWGRSGLKVLWILDGTIPGPKDMQWVLGPNDQFFPADLDGDGDQELLVYDGNSYVGVLKWQANALGTLWLTNQPFSTTDGGWTISPGNRFYALPGTSALIEVYDGAVRLGVLSWLSGALQLNSFIFTELSGPGGVWNLASGASFVVGDFDGNGIHEMLGYDSSGSAAVIAQGEVVMWTAAGQFKVWNLDFILASPTTPFAPFTGDQLSVYQYMSTTVYEDSDGDIRSEYTNQNIPDGSFQGYASQLAVMTNPSGQGFTDADWTAVQAVLVAELQNVGPLRGMFGNMNQLAGDLDTQQDTDLATAVQNVDQSIASNDDTVSYWLGQVLDAAIWGAAVFPEAKIGQLGLAVTASLFGGYLGSSGPPEQVSYSAFVGAIDEAYLDAVQQNGINQNTALEDAGMLAVAGRLAGQGWQWTSTESPDIALSSTNANRLTFYQILIPVRFVLVQFLDNPFDYPYAVAQQEAPWSYWSQANDDGTYNVYMLGYPDTEFHPYGFPSQDLMTDLFGSLGVAQSEFFLGQGPWSGIKQVSANS